MELIGLFILLLILNIVWSHFDKTPKTTKTPTARSRPRSKCKTRPIITFEFEHDVSIPTPKKHNKLPTTNPMLYTNQFCSAEEKAAHLKTEYWTNLKQKRLIFAQYKCEACGCSEFLYLHHVSYLNLLAEHFNDVVVVCYSCHQEIHDKLGYDRQTLYPISILKD